MRRFFTPLALLLALSCNAGEFGVMTGGMKTTGGGDVKVSEEVKQALKPDQVTKNEPPTVILDPRDLDHTGIDLSSALETYRLNWVANPIVPGGKVIADGASFTPLQLSVLPFDNSHAPYKQISRAPYSDELVQTGQNGQPHTDSFTSQAAGILDVLLVIDSSGSMSDEQAALKSNLPNLLTHVGASDWRVAVVNTDPKCKFRPPISKTTPNFEAEYAKMVQVGTSGGVEVAVYNAIRAMKGECGNSVWLRDGSTVAVIIVTDEPHQCHTSYAEVCGTAGKLEEYLHSIRAASDEKVFGLVQKGSEWEKESMFDVVGGIKDKSKYDEVFKAISSSVKASLKSSYQLTYLPDGRTFTVTVNGTAISSSDYTRSGKIITFNNGVLPKDRDVAVAIKYTYGSKPYVYDMTLKHMPLNRADAITVTVKQRGVADKTLVYDTHFSVSGKQLTFKSCSASGCAVLPAGATAQIKFKENITLNSEFEITASSSHIIMMDTLVVKVNGSVKSSPADFTAKVPQTGNKVIKFTSPPADGAAVSVAYSYLTTLSYPHTLHAQNIGTTCQDAHKPKRAVNCVHNNGHIEITADVGTDKLIITEKLSAGEPSLNHPLKGDYVVSSLKVKCLLGNGDSRDLAYSISTDILSLDESDFNACKQSALDGSTSYQVRIVYEVRKDEQDNFFIGYDLFAKHAGKYKFIYVIVEIDSDGDGVFSTVNPKDYNFDFDYYSAEDARVAFLQTLPDNTKVRATVYLLPY